MNLNKAIKQVQKTIKEKQDPDKVTYTKQWDEFGYLKGWMIGLTWGTVTITLDMTKHYTRMIGDLEGIPDYIKGKHQKI